MASETTRQLSERKIAVGLMVKLARMTPPVFSMLRFYDDDADFVNELLEQLGLPNNKASHNKLLKVARALVRVGALRSQMRGTAKEYLGEPAKQLNYILDTRYQPRLAPDLHPRYTPMFGSTPELEAEHLIRRAYPRP